MVLRYQRTDYNSCRLIFTASILDLEADLASVARFLSSNQWRKKSIHREEGMGFNCSSRLLWSLESQRGTIEHVCDCEISSVLSVQRKKHTQKKSTSQEQVCDQNCMACCTACLDASYIYTHTPSGLNPLAHHGQPRRSKQKQGQANLVGSIAFINLQIHIHPPSSLRFCAQTKQARAPPCSDLP